MTIQERILQVIDNKNITPYRFCKDLGLSMGYLDKRGAIGTDKYLKIIEYLSDVNPIWLLTGKEPMFKTEVISTTIIKEEIPQNDNEIITLLRDKIALLEENRALQEEKIKDLERRLAFAEVKDKEEMSLKIKTQRKEAKAKDEIIFTQNEEINALKSRYLPPDEPLQPSKGL